jgi:hypothetical protein
MTPALFAQDDVQTITVAVETLRTGIVLVDEVRTTSGTVLLRAGERLTADCRQRIQSSTERA